MELKEMISIEIPVIGLTRTITCGRCGQLMKGRMFNGYTDCFVCLRCLEKEEANKLTARELAETLLPDMTTVPMTDEEIQRFMKG